MGAEKGDGFIFSTLSPFPKNRLDLPFKIRQVSLHRRPHLIGIDAKIVVDHDVSHGDDLCPRDFGVRRSQRVREFSHGLSDDLDMVDHSGLKQFVGLKCRTPSRRIALNSLDRLDHIEEA